MAQPNDLLALFYDEAEELLVALDAGLRDLAAGRADGDRINAVFRAVHSIKGGAAAFGLAAVVAYAHDFETILDDLRAGRRGADAGLLADLLAASDHLADLVAAERGGSALPADRVAQARAALAALLPQAAPAGFVFEPLPLAALPVLDPQRFEIRFAPHAAVFAAGHEPGLILRDLAALGQAQITLDRSRLPAAAEFDPAQCYLAWQVTLETDADDSTIAALFDFVEGLCDLAITPAAADADAAPPPVAAPPPPRPTIRVDVERVDRLVDVAGELVIHQAMLAEAISTALTPAGSEVDRNLDLLRQLSRQIQDSIMAIRAQPVKPLFDRMHRILREAAASTGKSATLTTEGEGTEVDRTIIERLADPLTHMIRNAVDHGIEPAPIRAARGKPAMGAVTLAAAHRSGRIVITLSDDGGGIDRDRVRGIAVERGLIAASADLTPAEIDALLFLPGFSTAPTVSALSGRGVGMDVVRAEIAALGGRVAITSTPCQGTTLTISLPLTLAVLDGMVVTAAAQTLVLPVASIIETLRLDPATCHPLGLSDPLIEVRGRCLPMVDVGQSLGFRAPNGGDPPSIAVIVERDEQSAMALLVDTIRDQRQVVIKGLEANYGHIPGIAAATVLGDGSVALILDPTELLPPRSPAAIAAQ